MKKIILITALLGTQAIASEMAGFADIVGGIAKMIGGGGKPQRAHSWYDDDSHDHSFYSPYDDDDAYSTTTPTSQVPSFLSPLVQSYKPAKNNFIQKVANAVVTIESTRSSNVSVPQYYDAISNFFRESKSARTKKTYTILGSGVIVDGYNGIVVTTRDIVKNGSNFRVKMRDGSYYQARLASSDNYNGIVALKIQKTREKVLPALKLNAERKEQGDNVTAIGNPLGRGITLEKGFITAPSRHVQGRLLLQTNTPVHKGNAGGALVGERGSLVGIPNNYYSKPGREAGMMFATPAAVIKPLIEAARSNQKRVVHIKDGITPVSLTPHKARKRGLYIESGVLVKRLSANSRAKEAGLRVNDVIVSINGQPVKTPADFRIYTHAIGNDRTVLKVVRGKQIRKIWYDLKKKPAGYHPVHYTTSPPYSVYKKPRPSKFVTYGDAHSLYH